MAVFVPLFFFFFLNHVIIDLGTKSCMLRAVWHTKKTLIPKSNKGNNKIQTTRTKTLQAGSSEPCRIAIDD